MSKITNEISDVTSSLVLQNVSFEKPTQTLTVNPLTPTVVIWVQLCVKHSVPARPG